MGGKIVKGGISKVLSILYGVAFSVNNALVAYAQGTGGDGSGGVGGNGSGGVGDNGSGGSGLVNPLKSESLTQFILNIIDVLLTFAIPIIVFFIMYGGFTLVTARGDVHHIDDGKRAITWAVVGGVIVLGAKLIISVIQGTVSQL